ncbi:MAG: metallophosphoesterase family protein [Dethiobacteria bacterium]|jgi:exonuclease SbcD|nr:DNA repair exonuclease [Bacillota bacterium]
MSKVRFIHCADIHLGSFLRLSGKVPEEIFKVCKRAVMEAFLRIMDVAIEESVDFLLIAGDLYDREARSVKGSMFFAEQCCRLKEKNIPVFIISGNHDPFREQGEIVTLPDNVFIFSSEKVEIRNFSGEAGELLARVLGQSYRGRADSRKMHQFYAVPDTSVCNIALLHTQLDPYNQNYVPCSLSELKNKKGIHYWALGHIHQCQILNNGLPLIAYAGTPQGRGIGEQGLRGCLLVELTTEAPPRISFIPTSTVIWKKLKINIAGAQNGGKPPRNLSDLEELIMQRCEELLSNTPLPPAGLSLSTDGRGLPIKGFVLQCILTGRGELHELLVEQEDEVLNCLRQNLQNKYIMQTPFLWIDSIAVRTGKLIPALKDLSKREPIFAEIEKIAQRCLEDRRLQKELFAELGMIWESEFDPEQLNEERFQLDPQTLESIMEQAKELVAEKLWERRRRSEN